MVQPLQGDSKNAVAASQPFIIGNPLRQVNPKSFSPKYIFRPFTHARGFFVMIPEA
jgi:hypothetical protein